MNEGFVLLCEEQEMWAKMLMEMLKNNGIPSRAQGKMGAGFAMATGLMDRLRVYVPLEKEEEAKALYHAFFTEEYTEE